VADELWTVQQVADHFGVSLSRARTILADNGVQRTTGYPADQVKAIPRRGRGYRSDLHQDPEPSDVYST
jgi:hypothetical protein